MSHHDELVEKAKQAIREVAKDLSAPNGQRMNAMKELRDLAADEENRILFAKGNRDGRV